MNILFFDTETTGLVKRGKAPSHPDQPFLMQLGALLDVGGTPAATVNMLVQPNGRFKSVEPKAFEAHGISIEDCEDRGLPIEDVIDLFMMMAENADLIVAHNIDFDQLLIECEFARLNSERAPSDILCGKPTLCTMKKLTPICKIRKLDGRAGWKWPKLQEAYEFFFGEKFDGAHDAFADITATRRVFRHIEELGYLRDDFARLNLN
jgi:DNA polymerase-3 subunit epsilon